MLLFLQYRKDYLLPVGFSELPIHFLLNLRPQHQRQRRHFFCYKRWQASGVYSIDPTLFDDPDRKEKENRGCKTTHALMNKDGFFLRSDRFCADLKELSQNGHAPLQFEGRPYRAVFPGAITLLTFSTDSVKYLQQRYN